LKYSVPEFIKKNIDLMKKISEIKSANIEDGGDGAFYIYLKRKK
jgi:DNA-nicking Smr family endonuclease